MTVRTVHTALSPSLSYSLFQQIQQALTEWTERTTWTMVLTTPNQTGEKSGKLTLCERLRARV